jgi:hypothetical protein
MLTKCTTCKRRILGGGEQHYAWTFCSAECWNRFRQAVGARFSTPELIESAVNNLFLGNCPLCGNGTHLDIYWSTKVTGMLLMYTVQSNPILSCSSCGRRHRLTAAAHCLFAGGWSPRPAVINLFVLPTNLIAAAFIRQPAAPSQAIVGHVMSAMGEAAIPKLLSGELKLQDDIDPSQSPESS